MGSRQQRPRDEHANDVGHPERVQSPGAAAHYIETLTDELTQIARHHGLHSLAYILGMARLEAEQITESSDQGASTPIRRSNSRLG